jgi:hypothetical protein
MKSLIHQLEGLPPIQYNLGALQTRRDMFVHSRPNLSLPSLVDLDDRSQERVLNSPEFFRFAIVRNPYTRIVSAWQSKVLVCEPGFEYICKEILGSLPSPTNKRLVSFPEFLNFIQTSNPNSFNPHWRPQADHLFYNVLNFSAVGKLEQLGTFLSRFQQHLGMQSPFQLPSSNRSPVTVGVALTEEDASRIYDIYRCDFESFGYDRFDIPAPKHVANDSARSDLPAVLDEIVERNIIIGLYARDRANLVAQARWAPRHVWLAVLRRLGLRRNVPQPQFTESQF